VDLRRLVDRKGLKYRPTSRATARAKLSLPTLLAIQSTATSSTKNLLGDQTRGPVTATKLADGLDVAQVRRWIRAGRKLRIRYEDEAGKRTRRTIWPVMIGYTDAVRLIAAWCERRKSFRHFRTDRILEPSSSMT
jgi:predicted DNA-binding transcriptional regulator YafY